MGYDVKQLVLYSMDDNKSYTLKLPHEDPKMFKRFENLLITMKEFLMEDFEQRGVQKCMKCIYK